MQPMQLCIISSRRFEETLENAHWKNLNQCNQCDYAFSRDRQVLEAFENIQWRKVKQIEPIKLRNYKLFEEIFENTYNIKIHIWACGFEILIA